MKCKIPEIAWHNRDPVLSVDIQPKDKSKKDAGLHRLASGGTDSHVLIWYLTLSEDGTQVELEVAADLTRHQRAVNAVKWSPHGEMLASGDDESVIIIWKQKAESEPLNILEANNETDKEIWLALRVLRGHLDDVYDLAWSPDSACLLSGSVDNSAIVWDVKRGKSQAILNDHKGFVQGVAWDPKNQYLATLSSDRHLRIFDLQTKKVVHRVSKCTLPMPPGHEFHGKTMHIYHDDTLQTFFRRLCFTPDGQMLITPSGVTEGVAHTLHTSYLYSRGALKQPAIVLPFPGEYTVAVKCCPLLFKLRGTHEGRHVNPPVVALNYRMVFAIATRSSVYLYDTQQKTPFGVISNIHYTRLTDLTWSSDGRLLVVSSTDGFCSLITFERDELGDEYDVVASHSKQPSDELVSKKDHNVESPTVMDIDNVETSLNGQARTNDAGQKEQDVNSDIEMPPLPDNASDEPMTIETRNDHDEEEKMSPAKKITLPTTENGNELLGQKKMSPPAMPIAIRRHPRTLDGDNNVKESVKYKESKPLPSICDESPEKIRLHEDSKNENDDRAKDDSMSDSHREYGSAITTPEQTRSTANIKTPRRVPFRTISTPKSKKKLL